MVMVINNNCPIKTVKYSYIPGEEKPAVATFCSVTVSDVVTP
jgi:hypothetical protein